MFPTGCIAPEFCSSSCICEVPVCGDDVADGPEECDGIDNVMCHPIETCVAPGQPNECTCGPPPTCGNEVVDGAEECDNTAADSDCGPNMVCTASCFCFHADEIPALPRWQLGLLAAALLGSAGASYRWWARRQAPSR